MERGLKVFAMTLAVAALSVLVIFGFVIWVFIPLFPAAVVYLAATYTIKRHAAEPAVPARPAENESERRRAA